MRTTNEPSLAGRIALVTGAGRGIGRGIAVELARCGARIVAVGRNAERLAETCRLIAAAGGQAEARVADIAMESGRASLASAVASTDILVNNAAAFATYGPIEDLDARELGRVLDTIAVAPVHLIAACMPSMKERGFGRIVNIGSVAASLGAERQVAYASAKSALYGLTKSVALEGARFGVTCNLLDLGLIATERIAEALPEAIQRELIAHTPIGRAGTVEEVASVVAFLASSRASFITGASIPVSGGLGLGLFPYGPRAQ